MACSSRSDKTVEEGDYRKEGGGMRSGRTGRSDGKDLEEAGAETSRDGGSAAPAQACGV